MTLVACGQDLRHEGPHPVDDAPQIDIEHLPPVVESELPSETPVHHAGVVHCDMKCAVPIHGEVRDLLDGARVANVELHALRGVAPVTNCSGCGLDRFAVEVSHHYT